ncbi:thioredoxin domain-containing protein [Gordonia sp. (in: high G+C Gram-positive bacteria)]|uniref:DsbA family protein n=1 Tax=Gordonia sp. (in: high G+C Gram-positive bacteria) TaxID=84139 RepID=UPI0026061A2E|nr:thioredoxin domain-containing protein [Gordonia sp. (in: high G+C Gram-positive bacteria)]
MSKKPSPTGQTARHEPRATSSRSTYVLVGAGVLVIVLIVAGVLWRANKKWPPVDEKVLAQNASFIVGDRNAPTTVDVFEDFGCTHCKTFESTSGPALAAAVQAGSLRVRYHLLMIRDSGSGGYSSRGAGAVLCVARNGSADGGDSAEVFTLLHADLFAKADGESGKGPDNAQIADLAAQAGANEATRTCIADGALIGEAKAMAKTSTTQLENSNKGVVATPTVLVAGEPVDIDDGGRWVQKLVTGGPSS